jgi:hypothetical protein
MVTSLLTMLGSMETLLRWAALYKFASAKREWLEACVIEGLALSEGSAVALAPLGDKAVITVHSIARALNHPVGP